VNVHRRRSSGIGRPHRSGSAALSTAAVAVVVLATLGACSNDSSPAADPGATTAPVETATGEPGNSLENGLYFYPPVEGATLSYTSGGALGSTTSEVTVESVTSDADGQTVTVTEIIDSGTGQPVTVQRSLRTGADGSLWLNAGAFGAFGDNFTVTAEGDDVLIPSIEDLRAGDVSDGNTFVELTGSGLTMRSDVTYLVSGTGLETVTVPAGTTEAYVVKIRLDMTNNITGASTGTGRYWFVPGFGLVRQEFEVMGMTITTELVSSSVPLPS
jgi:hypothetical protein